MKARGALEQEAARKPQLARAEIVDKATRARFEAEIDGAIKRKNGHEGKLAGALRAVAPLSPSIRACMAEAAHIMLRRCSFGRDLYAACMRALAEVEDRHATTLLKGALASDDAGGSAALSAACFSVDRTIAPLLAKIAASRQSHLAFGAETARVVRGESNGAHLSALAPMIKESHRISLCVELFVPLARAGPSSIKIAPALAVLRGAERHLGRWLVMGEVAAKGGDESPLEEARSRSTVGPSSARAAWSLVAWALAQRSVKAGSPGIATSAAGRGPSSTSSPVSASQVVAPQARPTVELVSRLSDRPSADRDTTFLFRMARARATTARPMLEALAKSSPLSDEVAVRAALYLARDYGRNDLREAVVEAATSTKREELRGVSTAVLWDIGEKDRARDLTDDLLASKVIANVAWGVLLRAAAARSRGGDGGEEELVTETPFRWIQWGWLE